MGPTDHLGSHHECPGRLMMANAERHPRIVGSTIVIHGDTADFFVGVVGSREGEELSFRSECGNSTAKKRTTTGVASGHGW